MGGSEGEGEGLTEALAVLAPGGGEDEDQEAVLVFELDSLEFVLGVGREDKGRGLVVLCRSRAEGGAVSGNRATGHCCFLLLVKREGILNVKVEFNEGV